MIFAEGDEALCVSVASSDAGSVAGYEALCVRVDPEILLLKTSQKLPPFFWRELHFPVLFSLQLEGLNLLHYVKNSPVTCLKDRHYLVFPLEVIRSPDK